MSRTFTADRPGPLTVDLDIGLGEVHVVTEDREVAELTLEPTNPDDATARDLIERASESSTTSGIGVVVPRPAGSGSAGQLVQAGDMHGVVVSSADGIVVDGRPVGSPGSAGAVTVTARLPHSSSVSMRTSSADLRTTGGLTRVAYQSHSGSLTVDLAGIVESQTVSGRLRVANAATVRASTTSGRIRLDQVEQVTARSVSGAIELAQLRGTGRVESVSGAVRAHAVADADLAASTISGAIRLSAAEQVTFRTRPSTVSGAIHQPATQQGSA